MPRLGSIKLKDLRPEHIQGLYNEKLKGGMSSRSVIYIHQVLHKALKQAVKWGLIISNPTDAVNRPKFRRKEMQVLDDKQARTLLLAAKGTRYEALFWLAISTGMRQGELLGLKWSDIDWEARRVQVQRQVQPAKGGGYIFIQPKSAAGRRAIMLGESVIKVLRSQLQILEAERTEAGDLWQENDLVFPSSLGTPWHQRNVLKYYKRFLK
jgi:integrase